MALLHTPSSLTIKRAFYATLVAYPFPGNVVTLAFADGCVRLIRVVMDPTRDVSHNNSLPHDTRYALPAAGSPLMEVDLSTPVSAVARPRDGAVLLLREKRSTAVSELTLHSVDTFQVEATLPLPTEAGQKATNAVYNMYALGGGNNGRVLIMRHRKYGFQLIGAQHVSLFVYSMEAGFECLASRIIHTAYPPEVLGFGFPPFSEGENTNSVRVLLRLYPTRMVYTTIELDNATSATTTNSADAARAGSAEATQIAALHDTDLFSMHGVSVSLRCADSSLLFRVTYSLDEVNEVIHFVELVPPNSDPNLEAPRRASILPMMLRRHKAYAAPAMLRARCSICSSGNERRHKILSGYGQRGGSARRDTNHARRRRGGRTIVKGVGTLRGLGADGPRERRGGRGDSSGP